MAPDTQKLIEQNFELDQRVCALELALLNVQKHAMRLIDLHTKTLENRLKVEERYRNGY